MPREQSEHWDKVWEKVKGYFSAMTSLIEPYLGPGRLDYLEEDRYSVKERTRIEVDLMGMAQY